MYEKTLDRVTQYFTGERYLQELKVAREDYFRRTGKVFEDEPIFEIRMTAFLEWYLCDRSLWDTGIPPVRLFSEMFGETLDVNDVNVLRGLERSSHSLFLLISISGHRFKVQDLHDDAIYEVMERRTHTGLKKGDIFEGRVVSVGSQIVFSDAMWVHPEEAKEAILAETKNHKGKNRDEYISFLFDLAYMKLKCDRYQHVSPEQIYTFVEEAKRA